MKRILMAATAIAAVSAFATGAAAGSSASQGFTVNGRVAAKCVINATQTNVTLPPGSIADINDKAQHNIAKTVADGLEALDVHAWCNGNQNGVNLTRSALVNKTTGGTGAQDGNGFDNAVIYDIEVNIDGATRGGSGSGPVAEGTSDGPNGPGVGTGAGAGMWVSNFGPTGDGAKVHFKAETDGYDSATLGEALSSLGTNGPTGRGFTTSYTADNHRLAAGHYHGTVRLLLVPHV